MHRYVHEQLAFAVGTVVCTGVVLLWNWAARGFDDPLLPPPSALPLLAGLAATSALIFFWPFSLLPRTKARADAALPAAPSTVLPSTGTSLARSIRWSALGVFLVPLGVWSVFLDDLRWLWWLAALPVPESLAGALYWTLWERRRGKVLWVRSRGYRGDRPEGASFSWSVRTTR
jgi:hypothetical protein